MPAIVVLDNNRQPFAWYFRVLFARAADPIQPRNRLESSCGPGAFRSSRPVPPTACENRKAATLPGREVLLKLAQRPGDTQLADLLAPRSTMCSVS